MQPFRCMLCGEAHLGFDLPDRCPFCGATATQLVAAVEWIDYGKVQMSATSQDLCQKALELELSNTAFYRACAGQSENQITEAIFKRLSKHELEHAELLATMLGQELPGTDTQECPTSDQEKFRQAHAREGRAIKFYLEAAGTAGEPRVQEVFRNLAEVESEHLKLSRIFG